MSSVIVRIGGSKAGIGRIDLYGRDPQFVSKLYGKHVQCRFRRGIAYQLNRGELPGGISILGY
jgi:hypothetical protein